MHRGEVSPFLLSCEYEQEVSNCSQVKNISTDKTLIEFWSNIKWANLFVDKEFMQWGLEILPFEEALSLSRSFVNDRPVDFHTDDLIVGRFFGDSDVLVMENDFEQGASVLYVAGPIDKRDDWYKLNVKFSEFVTLVIQKQGDKFWE